MSAVRPQYSLELTFALNSSRAAMARIAMLCDPQSADRLTRAALKDSRMKFDLCLWAPRDVEPRHLQNYDPTEERTPVGIVYAMCWSEGDADDGVGVFFFHFAPCTRHMQWLFFTSMDFRTELCAILESCGGLSGAFMWEDCYPVEFWTPELGRHNDHRPEQRYEVLAEPLEFSGR